MGAIPESPAATPAAGSGDSENPLYPDTIYIAFIRVDFANDREGSRSTGDGHFDLSGPDTTLPGVDRAPHNRDFYSAHLEALKRYYDVQSYGRTVILGDVWPRSQNGAYTVSDMADFGPWVLNPDVYPAAVHMFRTMMFAADSQSIALGDRIPWDSYDRFLVIHAGSDAQSDIRGDSPLDIPSFTFGVEDTNLVIFPDSLNRPIDRVAYVPETESQDGFYSAINGVVAHENGHNLFGFSDLYNTQTGFPVVGLWSLMDSGNLTGSLIQLKNGDEIFATGLLPPSVDPFQRFFTTDSLAFREPTWGDTMAIRDDERHPDIRRVFLTSDEYLLLENRHQAPADTIELDQDSTTHVVLGPKVPDRFEYDALLPGGGVLVWHVDASVVPFLSALRPNPDYSFNTNPRRYGVSLIEADGLGDLGDPGSPFILGSPYDPFFVGNNATLSDSTTPNLKPHIGTRPHLRIDVLDTLESVMRVRATRTWQRAGWPVAADFPPDGPQLMAVNADANRGLEVCWAGGAAESPDSAAIFGVHPDGRGLGPGDTTNVFGRFDRRPRSVMAALPLGGVSVPGVPPDGPAVFAVSTYPSGPDTSHAGGRVWLVDHQGVALPGWPARLPFLVTTPPAIAGSNPTATVYVGCSDGRVYALTLAGTVRAVSTVALSSQVVGRLAADAGPLGAPAGEIRVAAGGASGDVVVLRDVPGGAFEPLVGWPLQVGAADFTPDFLWIDFDGGGRPASGRPTCGSGERVLIVHSADRLWAYCPEGSALPGWGRALGDTLVSAVGAGDPDGDGYEEVLTQSKSSRLAFWNQSGYPSPGWPKRATRETFRTDSPPLVVDVDGDHRGDVVAMNASGILAALASTGQAPPGWPLATGSGAVGSPVAADLDQAPDGSFDIVAPDRAVTDSLRGGANSRFGALYAYAVPGLIGDPRSTSWTMLGGDPGRTCTLSLDRSVAAAPASAGPLIAGSFQVYPNPARRRPVAFAYRLTEPADVEFRILNASGHQVASFHRAGKRSDNLEVWDPGEIPAGLYLARLKFRGASTEHDEVTTVGLIR